MGRRAVALLLLAAVLAQLCLGAPGHVLAQAILPLNAGQPVNGQVTRTLVRQVYTFRGSAGDVIDLRVTVTGGTLDPILILTNDQSRVLARDDDGAGGLDAAILGFTLPATGAYLVTVARYGQERGLTTGTYTLQLSVVSGAGAASETVLRYGDDVVGEVSDQNPEHVYGFNARRGDVIRIAMERISGDLDPLLILAEADGHVLSVNDEDPTKTNSLDAAVNAYLVLKTGSYLIVATRFGREAGTTRGGYTLSLSVTPPETLGFSLNSPLLMDYGTTQVGDIADDPLRRFYQFEGRKGDVVTINVERTRGNLDPTLTLYGANDAVLARHDTGQRGQSARISLVTLQADGFFVVEVSRYGGSDGFTAGSFRLTLIGRQGVTIGANGTLILPYGGAVTSAIDVGSLDHQYVFQGKAGDVIAISMEPTSGDLLPYVILFDPSRRLVAQDDPNQPTAARLTQVRLTATGIYVIIATRHGRGGGVSRGNYLLTLTRVSN